MITIRFDKSKKCNGDYSMYLSFPYDEAKLNIIRNLPSRYWNSDTKEWEIPSKKLSTIVNAFQNTDIMITGCINEACAEKKPIHIPDIDFKFKTVPFDHQVEGFNYGLQHNTWLLGDEQGLGKTKQVIDIAVAKKQIYGLKHCLIVCGVNGLKWNWLNEVHTHSEEDAWILGQRVRKGRLVVSSNKDKIADLHTVAAGQCTPYFIITNVESLRDKEIQELLNKCCKDGTIGMVAIDEIHKCKNPTSQQGKGIMKLTAPVRIAMTGTPLLNTPMDLYVPLRWLGYEKHSFSQFQHHHCLYGGFGGYEVIGYRYLEELEETLHEMMLRRLKDEVLNLPEKIYVDDYVEMTAKQEQIYKEIKMDLQANIDKIKCASNPLAEIIRLRQATGDTSILSSTIAESAKLDRLEDILEENISNGRKVVIFSNWTSMTDAAQARLGKLYDGIVITGETPDADRMTLMDKFQTDPKCKYALGTTGAMGTGFTLTAGSVVVFLDEPWTNGAKEQAIDRTHRIGTKSNVTVITLLCKGTVDERVHEIVLKKGAMSDALIDGKITGNRADLVDFLLS